MTTSCVIKCTICICQTVPYVGRAYSESPRNWPFGFSAIPWYQHTAPMGRSVTYQFTKSTPAVNAPCSQLGARAQHRGMPRNSQDYSRWTKPREGANLSPVKLAGIGGERERTNKWRKSSGGCWLSVERQALHQWSPPPRAAGALA